jgi:hypothetical protein
MTTQKSEALRLADHLKDFASEAEIEFDVTCLLEASAELSRLHAEVGRLTTEQSAPVRGPDYAWPTVDDYENDVGFKVNQAFKIAWNMARTTNGFINRLTGTNPPAAQRATCTWAQVDDMHMPDTWQADCGTVWTFTDGGPKDNDMKFCPKCGKNVEQKGGAA